ncbi:MAG: phytanoyl-CoA dioxygenase family protein [Acidimicrobiia bacterium]
MRSLTSDEAVSHAEAIAGQGWSVIDDAIEPELADELVATLDRLETELGVVPADNSFEGRRTTRIYNLLVHGDVFARVPTHPAVLPVVEAVLDPGCLLSSLSSITIGPGESAQPIHADDQLIPIPKPHPPVVCNTMWALTDFTEANGATRLVPGSHLQSDPDFGGRYESVAAEMRRGSVLVWNGSLWHGGGANTTDERRIGLACNYCAGFIRQQENQQLGIPREVAQRFDDRLARLCGYGTYNGLIGHIDKRDPLELLRGDAVAGTGRSGVIFDQT